MKNAIKPTIFLDKRKQFLLKKQFLLLFLLSLCFSTAMAEEMYSQKLSINVERTTIGEVFTLIEKNTDYVFLISDEIDKELSKTVSVHVTDKPVESIIGLVTQNTNLDYKIVERQVTVYGKKGREDAPTAKAIQAPRQQIFTARGIILDANNEPVIGANIRLKRDQSIGTVADVDGNFSINGVAANDVLIISSVGFETREYVVRNEQFIQIILHEMTASLEELVVVGYGTQKKLALTGSVISTSGESIQKSASVDVSQSLAGRMPGVIVNNRSGEPGSEATTIFIRGRSTLEKSGLNTNAPLIVIDGVPGRESLSYLNPNDIENITILKDASAAIYGNRSANGVILVTTKRGKRSEKPNIVFSYDLGIQQPTRLLNMVDAPTFATLYNEWSVKNGTTPRYRDDEIQKFMDGSDPIQYPNTDWFDAIIKPASFQHKYNVTFSGGTNTVAYFLSVGAVTQDGIYRESATSYDQLNLRSNIDINVTSNFKVGIDVSGRIQKKHYSAFPSDSYGIFYRTRDRVPTAPVYYPEDRLAGAGNPLALVSERTGYDRTRLQRVNTTLTAEWNLDRLLQGLSLRGHVAYDNANSFRKIWKTPYTYWSYVPATAGVEAFFEERVSSDPPTPQLRENYSPSRALTLNVMANYERSFNDTHNLGVMIGMERSSSRNDILEAAIESYSTDALDELFAGNQDKTYFDVDGKAAETARLGYIGRITYDYKAKYLLQLLGRIDGSENFPKGSNRWGFFPGVSVGWRISEEGFMRDNLPAVDNLKIKASYGEQGNDRIAAFQYLTLYQYGRQQVMGGTAVQGIYPSVFPNPNVTWEVAKTWNIGVEGQLWSGLLGFEAEVFKTRRSNILTQRNASVPDFTGLTGSLPDENIGIVENKGFEVQLTHAHSIGDWAWNVSGNFLFARNEVVYIDEAPWGEGYDYLKAEGHPLGSQLLYEAIGINKTEDDLLKYPQFPGAKLGDLIFKRNDPNPSDPNVITSMDRTRVDLNTVPEIVFGLSVDARWKFLDLTMLFQGQTRAKYIITPRIHPNEGNIMQDIADGRWTPENPTADKPGIGGTPNGSISTYWHRDASFFRLKNMEIGFTMPKRWLMPETTKLEGLRVYVGGYNLLTFDKLKIVDPETNSSENQNYPQLRIFNVGLKLTF